MSKWFSKTTFNLILIIVSFIVLFLNERYIKANDEFLYSVIQTICITVVTASIVYIIDNCWGNNFDKIAELYFPVLKDCHKYGLIGIYNEFPIKEREVEKSFMESKEVFIIMNDAKGFISGNDILKARMKIPNCKTIFVLQDFNQKDTISALTRKNGHAQNPNYYVSKIKEVIQYDIDSLNRSKDPTHELLVYLNNNYNTMAIILTDSFAMFSVYRVFSEKGTVPHFVFKKEWEEYDYIKKDVINITTKCKQYELHENPVNSYTREP